MNSEMPMHLTAQAPTSTERVEATTDQAELINRLESLRIAQGLTYYTLGVRSGLHHSTVHQMLTGYRKSPTYVSVAAVAKAMGYDLGLAFSKRSSEGT